MINQICRRPSPLEKTGQFSKKGTGFPEYTQELQDPKEEEVSIKQPQEKETKPISLSRTGRDLRPMM